MRQQRSGRIISMSSSTGLRGNSGQANYGAAKTGIAGFTRVVARDLGRYGVTVNTISPGGATRMTLSEEVLAARQIRADKGVESGRQAAAADDDALQNPELVAPMVVYLATDAAAYINGCCFTSSRGTIALHAEPLAITIIHSHRKDGPFNQA